MAKLSRSAFIAMVAGASALLLTGCGAGTDKNSFYSGVYRSNYSIPELNETGTFNFTVDVKGQVLGTLKNVNRTRTVYAEIKNNGELKGTTTDAAASTTGELSGKVAAASGSTTTGSASISGGNFVLSENGRNYSGDFTTATTTTTQ